jgi:hypothetical protein
MTAPKMTTTARMMLAMTPVALCAAAGSADVPGVLNHVPADSAIYAVVPDVGRLLGDLTSLNTAMAGKLPPEAAQIGMGLFFAQSIVNQPGFNQNGSAAIIVTPPEGGFDAGDPAVTALLPIEDLEAFAKAPFMAGQGASFADGMASVTMDGDTLHMRDLGEFTVAGNDKAAIEAFRAGEFIGAHTEALGVSGVHAVEGSDLMFVLSVAQLDEPIGEALAQLEQQANFLAMMGGGEQVTQGMGALKHAMETIRRDGSVIMFTADPGDAGVTLDTGVSFRPDTESAKVFDSMADSGELLGALPNENFLVAYSMDTSSEGIGSLLKMLGEMGGAQGMDMGLAAAFAQSTGASGMVGTSPAALGGAGLLSKQITYTRAANPGEAVASMSKALKEMNGQSMMGMKYTTTYEAGASEVAGITVDSYSVKTTMDMDGGNNAMGMMMDPAMINSMLFGMAGGPSGYVAKVDGGYYQTSSKNSELLTAAVNAGKAGEGLNTNAMLAKVAPHLHPGRFGEAYVALDQAFNTFGPFAQMMGLVDQFEPLEPMPPLALSMVGEGGGLRLRMHWPVDTLGFVLDFASKMDAGGMMDPMGGGGTDAEPEF